MRNADAAGWNCTGMKRARGKLFTLASVVSQLLCVAAVALWVRDYDRLDWASYVNDKGTGYAVGSTHGLFSLWHFESISYVDWSHTQGFKWRGWQLWPPQGGNFAVVARAVDNHVSVCEREIFKLRSMRIDGPLNADMQGSIVYVRCWLVASLLSLLPLISGVRGLAVVRKKLRAARVGTCSGCGYDLRATPDRCPECGNAVPKKTEMTV
jgi:hypothetical protein